MREVRVGVRVRNLLGRDIRVGDGKGYGESLVL